MVPKEVASSVVSQLPDDKALRLLLAGPVSVGKSTVAESLCSAQPHVRHIEHDRLKRSNVSCGVGGFDPERCFAPQIEAGDTGFVIDIGGDSIFRASADNRYRLRQLVDFKEKHGVTVVLLTATRDTLRRRFLSSKERTEDEFVPAWTEWQVAEPFWNRCTDIRVDTS